MAYEVPKSLPWGRFVAAWEQAEESLARLDQVLRVSHLAEGWMSRAHFEEACATIWVEGGLVPLEDLVLIDANTPVKIPDQALFRARAALLSRRSLARQKPDEALSAESILGLQERRERLAREFEPDLLIDYDPAWNTEGRLIEWLGELAALDRLPAIPAAAMVLQAWHRIEPLQYGSGALGRLLVPVYLWHRGKTTGQSLCLSVGLKGLRWHYSPELPLGAWLHDICRAIAESARHGLALHQKLALASTQIDRRLEGRRRSSRLSDLARLIYKRPLVSAPLVAKELKISQTAATGLLKDLTDGGVIREMTGRARFRAYGIL